MDPDVYRLKDDEDIELGEEIKEEEGDETPDYTLLIKSAGR